MYSYVISMAEFGMCWTPRCTRIASQSISISFSILSIVRTRWRDAQVSALHVKSYVRGFYLFSTPQNANFVRNSIISILLLLFYHIPWSWTQITHEWMNANNSVLFFQASANSLYLFLFIQNFTHPRFAREIHFERSSYPTYMNHTMQTLASAYSRLSRE